MTQDFLFSGKDLCKPGTGNFIWVFCLLYIEAVKAPIFLGDFQSATLERTILGEAVGQGL